MNLYERVKKLASEKGDTIAEVERNLGLSNGSISKWDKHMPNGIKLKQLADYFNISVDGLLEDK